jgi:hypothetical protein
MPGHDEIIPSQYVAEACAGANSFRAAALSFNLERRRGCPLDLTIWSTM